jgi:hypothetical protein
MQPHAIDTGAGPGRKRFTLWVILALCAAPIIASYVAYHFWRPSGHVNYGELLEPRPLSDAELVSLGGERFSFSQLKGSWILLTATTSEVCDAACNERLVYMRQVRLAQGKESDRIERVWVIARTTKTEAALIAEHPGLHIVRDMQNALVPALPRGGASEPIYIVDPLGNLMMRFPADPDPRRILKDMSRLLRHSKWK